MKIIDDIKASVLKLEGSAQIEITNLVAKAEAQFRNKTCRCAVCCLVTGAIIGRFEF